MRCEKCNADNEAGAKFCEACGFKLRGSKYLLKNRKMIVISSVIGLILISLVVGLILITPSKEITTQNEAKQSQESKKEVVCNRPYIGFEGRCCLDNNDNNICDEHEEKTIESEIVPEKTDTSDKSTEEYRVLTIRNNQIVFPNVFLFEGQKSIDIDKQKNRNVFSLTTDEFYNIERADLRFVPYCRNVEAGVLDIEVNGGNVFSAVPICEEAYRQPIPLGVLNVGENVVIFKSNEGAYSVEQIKLEFVKKEVESKVYFFEVTRSQINDIKIGRAHV